MASDLLKTEYLVAYDYGTGAVWGVVSARSPHEIMVRYPKLTVYKEHPDWMSCDHYEDIKGEGVIDIESDSVPDWIHLTNSE
jgi:hypothetical protein